MTLTDILDQGARRLGVSLTPQQVETLFLFLDELQKWNQKIRLTAIEDRKEMVIKHLLDSISYFNGFAPREGMRLMDIGAGAGFPGIPLKICAPEISVTLIESSQKKSAFLNHAVRTLKLGNVSIMAERIEKLGEPRDVRRRFDIIAARALGSTEQVVQWSRPWLHADGKLLLSKGPDVVSETNLFRQKQSIDGLVVQQIIPFTLPFSDYQRNLVVLGLR